MVEFLRAHVDEMRDVSPPESKHALDLEGLRQPEVTLWTVWDREELLGCAALAELDREHGEIKSMRSAAHRARTGVASQLLQHIVGTARDRGYRRISLETGSMDHFEPARKLYRKHGFSPCGPFACYREDPASVFMTLGL